LGFRGYVDGCAWLPPQARAAECVQANAVDAAVAEPRESPLRKAPNAPGPMLWPGLRCPTDAVKSSRRWRRDCLVCLRPRRGGATPRRPGFTASDPSPKRNCPSGSNIANLTTASRPVVPPTRAPQGCCASSPVFLGSSFRSRCSCRTRADSRLDNARGGAPWAACMRLPDDGRIHPDKERRDACPAPGCCCPILRASDPSTDRSLDPSANGPADTSFARQCIQ